MMMLSHANCNLETMVGAKERKLLIPRSVGGNEYGSKHLYDHMNELLLH